MSLFKKQEKKEDVAPKDLIRKVQELEKKLGETNEEMEALRRYARGAITRVGVLRFNPFKEIGGDQSFSIALLDDKQSGVLITSYYGRELNRVYAKEIRSGVSRHELSEEEKEVIHRAMRSENQK